jgi:AhpD family alkylhydroperoxidase
MQKKFKQKFTYFDLYDATVRGLRAFPWLVINRIQKTVSNDLIERLMLATTEVNGCEVCSYAHTQIALKQGFSKDEIDAFLSGSKAYVHAEEATAILFAQHYADSKARPDLEAYLQLQTSYGKKQANIMLSGIQMMMMANIQGVSLSALIARFKGKSYSDSSLFYELSMLLLEPIFIVFGLIHALLLAIFRRPRFVSKK